MKQCLLFLATFILLLCSVNFAQQTEETMDPTAAAYYNKAVTSMQSQDFEGAVAILDSSLKYSQDYRIYYQKGNALLKTGKIEDAKAAYNNAIAKNSKFDKGYYSLAGACLASNDFDGAIANYQKVSEVSSDEKLKSDAQQGITDARKFQAVDLYNGGNTALKANNFAQAIELYNKSLAIANDSKTHYQKGIALSKMDKDQEAIASFKSSVALDDSFDLAYVAMAGVYSGSKKYPEAIANYEKASQVTKNEALKASLKEAMAKTYLSAGSDAVKDKKYDAAIDAFKKSNSISESDFAYFSIGKAYVEKKQYDKANEAFDKASSLKKVVSDGAIAYYKGVMALDKKDNAKAAEFFKVAVTDPAYKKAASAQLDYLKKVAAAKK